MWGPGWGSWAALGVCLRFGAPPLGGSRGQVGVAEACVPPQFFVMLLLVFLLEATIAILFFAYTDKVQPSPPSWLWVWGSILTFSEEPWCCG